MKVLALLVATVLLTPSDVPQTNVIHFFGEGEYRSYSQENHVEIVVHNYKCNAVDIRSMYDFTISCWRIAK